MIGTTLHADANLRAWELLAQFPSTPTSPEGPEFGKASPIGLVLTLVLLVAIVLLVRSMNKRLKRLPESFDPERPEPDQAADDGTDQGAVPTEDADHSDAAPGRPSAP
ncbi:hypothetical protein [Rhodococcus rhodnii]|uniref:Uncharacterized protein n=1 Tax=Rhodococcus rhodnii LMG 5362 TaxID=1273125 RepID=R7WJX7_9NOCA|nr:hypothetical protein [Rhodococcus rhodnii]EOM75607.1 hypothetical protein Rrhod_3067 [Rhodococcus rhodnii LMG 5362]